MSSSSSRTSDVESDSQGKAPAPIPPFILPSGLYYLEDVFMLTSVEVLQLTANLTPLQP